MSRLDDMTEEPWRFDFLGTMRLIERSHPEKPRIGDSAAVADETVRLGQDPYMAFPASNLSKVEVLKDGRLQVLTKFLGLLGPQGALPLATTEEALGWQESLHDDAFPRFADLLNNRFLQLFFRAWADARPISQHDQPDRDRFKTYIGAMVGIGTETLQDLDTVPDAGKLNFAGLAACQTKSASRLRHMVRGLFGVQVEIDEFVGSRLALEVGEQTKLGDCNSRLGDDMILGGSCFSVEDKFRLRIYVRDLAQYMRFLPTGDRCEPLADLVFYYVGEALDWEVELALPTAEVAPMRLGSFGQIGWTTWLSPNWASTDAYRCDARFHPASRLREKRQRTHQS
ncbi:type VI secretion system baseplate subunit TssG [Hyphomicrobiales bacterium BP6-180914]|uniref:Type VI secretion system baseplate subunit TssG n=2 Tax=Lichenifustis flavocetrariae TaxID=2949735 RepID=A0AA41Z2S9_9HYPH|nr:type VI secretion system baseplate subunit TssG [Lichenifustis flavocetrariae]